LFYKLHFNNAFMLAAIDAAAAIENTLELQEILLTL
jgi:hypothetical protein